MTENAKNLWQRLAEAQSKVDYVQKEKKQGMNYSIVSHDAVTAKVRPVLVECGVLYHPVAMVHTQNGNRTEVAMTVRFVNVDKPEEFIDVPSLGYGIDAQDKGPGKAISYAVKYALLKALGLETGDDPDLDQSVEYNPTVKALPPTHKNTNKNSMAEKDALCNEINNIASMAVLTKWKADNAERIEGLSDAHFHTVQQSYLEKRDELSKGAAA